MSIIDDMNDTEIFYKAQEMNPNVSPSMPRAELLAIATGKVVDLPERSVDKVRLTIMAFINENWEQVSAFISCPASSRSPRACFQCTDMQAVECALQNRNIIFKGTDNT